MKNKLTYTFLMALLSAHFASNVEAVNCGDYLIRDATLTADLNCVGGITHAALAIGADNVTLNLNGFTISGPNEMQGIYIVESSDVTIKGNGGAIKGFWSGINATLSDNLTVSDTTFYELGAGVIVSSGNHTLIENNDFIYVDTHGVSIQNSIEGKGNKASNNTVNNNEFYKNGYGVFVCGERSDNNTITNNLIWKSLYSGIELNHSNSNNLYYNDILDSEHSSIQLVGASNNFIRSNSLKGGGVGVSMMSGETPRCYDRNPDNQASSFKNTVTGNHVFGFINGILVGLGVNDSVPVYYNSFNKNKIYDNDTGINFQLDASNNEAFDNVFTGTNRDIIDDGTDNNY